MRSRTEYVRQESVKEIRRQIATHKRFKRLVDEWIDLSIEHSRLTMQIANLGPSDRLDSTLAGESRMASWDPITAAVVRVQTMPKGEEIVALCEKHHWKVIVGIEPDQPEDLSDIDLLLSASPEALGSSRSARIGRNDPCPCGSGKSSRSVARPLERMEAQPLDHANRRT